ncbi:hypothetical protein PtA15_2A152 [Puccinia triticina]|uniref:Uncharacterized protein n=1 Tax=Puccinia triticina TaxID=208348 RepID=A0ABY7CAM5_9BASI|nr:uncharacterized protein PtA15_2A152 [Puccinia triticina]WAQ81840.1 hypothetical protein PtA15_2A152 [Puccinia triticina]WAR52728.1 hypothetical protein PtB15_2B153 [Puccinia triticina]
MGDGHDGSAPDTALTGPAARPARPLSCFHRPAFVHNSSAIATALVALFACLWLLVLSSTAETMTLARF